MMEFLINPAWLFGYDVVFKFVLALVTGMVSFYAFKVYGMSGANKSKLLGFAFSLYSLSYLLHALFSLSSFSYPANLAKLTYLGAYYHMIFFLWGTVTVIYMLLGIKQETFYFMMLALIWSVFFLSNHPIYIAYIMLSVMLLYIFIEYVSGCVSCGRPKGMAIPTAFGLLFLSHVQFIFSISNQLFYAFGNIIELAAFLIVLINLVVVITK